MHHNLQDNFFTLLQQPIQYELDRKALRARHRELQAQWHPDRFTQSDSAQRLQAVQQSALVNEAKSTLEDPVERARYLLELYTGEELDHNQTTSDPKFLMEQMLLREELDGCRKFDDAEGCLGCSEGIIRTVKGHMQEYIGDFQQQLESADYTAAAESVRKMRFLAKVSSQLNDFQQEIEDDLLH